MPQSLQSHLPELLPEYKKISSVVNGPGRNPLGSVSKFVEAVVDISNQLPAHGKLSLDVSWEEVLGPSSQLTVRELISHALGRLLELVLNILKEERDNFTLSCQQ